MSKKIVWIRWQCARGVFCFGRFGIAMAIVLFAGACLWTGCFVPPSANLQSARTMEREKVRLTPYWNAITETGPDSEKLADEFGILAGVGMGHGTELQVRYDRIQLAGTGADGYNFTSLGPKFSFANQHLAFLIPVGIYYGSGISAGETFQLHPGLIGTMPLEEFAEFSLATRLFLAPSNSVDEWFVLNFNVGFSNDTSRWAIIPEVGVSWNLSQDNQDPLINYGVALAYYTP